MRKLLLVTAALSLFAGQALATQRATENRGAYDPSTDSARSTSWNKLATYHYDGSYTPYATATDAICVNGSATKTVKLTQFSFRPVAAAASNVVPLWIKRGTADTGGTPTSRTAFAVDSASAATTGAITEYAAAPTVGSTVGTLMSYQAGVATTGSTSDTTSKGIFGNGAQLVSRPDGTSTVQFPTLHGVAEGVCLNFAGASLPAGLTFTYSIEWTEN